MKRWLDIAGRIAWLIFPVVASVVAVLLAVGLLPWTINWEIWPVLTAIGTVGATAVAVVLALISWVRSKSSTAKLVSAWVTDELKPSEFGQSYERTALLHVANESNEPVYKAYVVVHIGDSATPIGPLSAPDPISVLPPRREVVFDISVPLFAHEGASNLRASLNFEDPNGRRWGRDPSGQLSEATEGSRWVSSEASAEGILTDEQHRQLGRFDSPFNPMGIALSFLATLRNPELPDSHLDHHVSSLATGWERVDWDEIRTKLDPYQPTSMVVYPAPRIARVTLVGDESLQGMTAAGDGDPIILGDAMFMTLVLEPGDGWRVFSVGSPIEPTAVNFNGTLLASVRPYEWTSEETPWSDAG